MWTVRARIFKSFSSVILSTAASKWGLSKPKAPSSVNEPVCLTRLSLKLTNAMSSSPQHSDAKANGMKRSLPESTMYLPWCSAPRSRDHPDAHNYQLLSECGVRWYVMAASRTNREIVFLASSSSTVGYRLRYVKEREKCHARCPLM